jgi:hypothetical protein
VDFRNDSGNTSIIVESYTSEITQAQIQRLYDYSKNYDLFYYDVVGKSGENYSGVTFQSFIRDVRQYVTIKEKKIRLIK